MNLVEQFDSWINEVQGDFKVRNQKIVKEILEMGLDIFRGWVPIDTEQLKQNIIGEVHESNQGFEIRIHVKNIDLSYVGKKSPINAIVLGLILEKGSRKRAGGKRGPRIQLTRTQNQEYAAAKTSTADWFEKAGQMWEDRANQLLAKML